MSNTHPLVTVPVKYGLFGGFFSIVLFLILYFLGKNPLVVAGIFDFGLILIPIFIFFSIKEFRDYRNNKELRFWQGMTVGFINYVTIATVSALFIWLFLTLIDEQLLTSYIGDRTALLVENKQQFIESLGDITYEETLVELENTTAYIIAVDDFLKKVFIGLFLTIIFSVILRR